LVNIRPVGSNADDAETWATLRHRLWPLADPGELLEETRAYIPGTATPLIAAAFFAEDSAEHRVLGFIELSIRPFADGCDSRPVPYVEGWYVEPAARKAGVGRALMSAAEAWARDQGFSELSSDTEIENVDSLAAHSRCGFVETDRLVKLRKAL
jgi:aminoglycoside 6'-N-acetyltransferase I